MIHAGSDKGIYIDLGNNEPGMILQRRDREGGYYVWRNFMLDGKQVRSPVDIESLSAGRHKLVE